MIGALGAPASHMLLGTNESIGRLRGTFRQVNLSGFAPMAGPTAECLPIYHPAYLLRNPADKAKAWEDLKQLMTAMGIPMPPGR